MAVKRLTSGAVVLSNAEYLHVTPWKGDNTFDFAKATSDGITIDFKDIVGDTLSFTPDDNATSEKPSEFTAAPLIETITLGKIQFAATCIDFHHDVLKTMMGWGVDEAGNAFAPNVYPEIYVTLEVGFKNEDIVVVAPKVKLNSKAIISTMKTGSAEGNLAGTCFPVNIAVGESVTKADFDASKNKVFNAPMAILQKYSDPEAKKTPNFYLIEVATNSSMYATMGKFKVGDGLQKSGSVDVTNA